jgi:hypothetical protein
MKMNNFQKRVSVAVTAIPLVLCSIFVQDAKADMFRSLSAGQENWINVTLDEGRHAIIANSPGSLGDVDIYLYDTSGEYVMQSNSFGTDRIDFTVNRGGTYYIKYKMSTCINPFGACNVSLDFF